MKRFLFNVWCYFLVLVVSLVSGIFVSTFASLFISIEAKELKVAQTIEIGMLISIVFGIKMVIQEKRINPLTNSVQTIMSYLADCAFIITAQIIAVYIIVLFSLFIVINGKVICGC